LVTLIAQEDDHDIGSELDELAELLAELLRVPPQTIAKNLESLLDLGFPIMKIGWSYRFSKKVMLAWLCEGDGPQSYAAQNPELAPALRRGRPAPKAQSHEAPPLVMSATKERGRPRKRQ